jgi:hypothetical protein
MAGSQAARRLQHLLHQRLRPILSRRPPHLQKCRRRVAPRRLRWSPPLKLRDPPSQRQLHRLRPTSNQASSTASSSTSAATSIPGTSGGVGGGGGLSPGATAAISICSLVATLLATLVALNRYFQKKRHLRLFQIICGIRKKGNQDVELLSSFLGRSCRQTCPVS